MGGGGGTGALGDRYGNVGIVGGGSMAYGNIVWRPENPFMGITNDSSAGTQGSSSLPSGGGGGGGGGGGNHGMGYGVTGGIGTGNVGAGGSGYVVRGMSGGGGGGVGGNSMGTGVISGTDVANVQPFSGSSASGGGGAGTAGTSPADGGEFMGHPLGKRRNSSLHSEPGASHSGPTVRATGKRSWQYNIESKSEWWTYSAKVCLLAVVEDVCISVHLYVYLFCFFLIL